MQINYFGISTHNLKHLNFSLENNEILLLKGVSGCGKSSLAIDTIYQISADEMAQLTHCYAGTTSYSIEGYNGIIPAICLKQENYNTNPRSTIGTYFNLNQHVQNVFSYLSKKPHSFFQFSNLDVACPTCHGLGTIPIPNIQSFLDCFSKLSPKCFRMWCNSDSEFYSSLFYDFCEEKNIPINCSFNDLTPLQQERILYGESKEKKTIKYKCNGKRRSRTGRYQGPMIFLENLVKTKTLSQSDKKYFNDGVCPECHGSRFSNLVNAFTFNGHTIADIYLMEFGDLYSFFSKSEKEAGDAFIKKQCQLILPFLKAANEVKLDYLTLNRSIPTLSGGEFQRVSLAKASVVQFNGFLYVMDEPVSALHPEEYKVVKSLIRKIRDRGNSLLVIEHSNAFDDLADREVFLGPSGGQNGGRIIQKKDIVSPPDIPAVFFPKQDSITIHNSCFNNVDIHNLQIPIGSFVGICGVSGSGKTTFLRDILSCYLKKSVYLNQSSIRGNSYSLVATATNVMSDIEKYYAQKTKKEIKNFWFSSEGPGQCPVCHGTGIITDKSIGWNSEYQCPECRGKRFSNRCLSYKIDGLSIYDFLNVDIDSLLEIVPNETPIAKKIKVMSRLGLGYIKLFQNTETLSGGEIQRLKIANALLKYRNSSSLVLDEPFRGLDKSNVNGVISYFYELLESGCSIFVVEHEPYVLSHCSYLIEFGPGSGKHGGKILYNGPITGIKECKKSLIAPYL